MIPLALQLLESPNGNELGYFSNAESCTFDTGEHGFRSLTCTVPMPLSESFIYYDTAPGKWLSLNYGGGVAWEGRVEDRAIVSGGLRLTAFGAWRALMDVPYTALWSDTLIGNWFTITGDEFTNAAPERFELNNDNHLYIAPKKDTALGTIYQGVFGYLVPSGSYRQITGIQFDYEMDGTSTYEAYLQRRDTSWTALGAALWSLTGTGSAQTGSVHLTVTACDALSFRFGAGSSTTYTGETGETYLKITNLRVVTSTYYRINTTTTTTISAGSQAVTPASMTGIYVGQRLFIDAGLSPSESVVVTAVTSSTFTATFVGSYSGTTTVQAHAVYADWIITDLIANYLPGINPDQLSADTSLIQSPGVDLLDESYEDVLPGDIATYLASLGDNETPPRRWEVGVWENQMLHFRPQSDAARAWSVDVDDLSVDSTIETLINSVYAVYQDANGRTLRTAVSDDDESQARYGIVRRQAISARTTSSTQAGIIRDTALADGATIAPRSSISPDYLLDEPGAIYPKWMCRAGDTLTIRNLSPAASVEIDRIRTFRLSECGYDVINDKLRPVPEKPLPSLEFLIARQAEGIR